MNVKTISAATAALALVAGATFFGSFSATADDQVITDPVVAEVVEQEALLADPPTEEVVVVEEAAVVEEVAPEPGVADSSRVAVDSVKLSICHSGSGKNWTYIAPDANGYNGHKNHDADVYGLSEADCLAKNEVAPAPETVEVFWDMPNGGTPDDVTWPQTYNPAQVVACGVWDQVDTYLASEAPGFYADGILTQGEDYGSKSQTGAISWRFVYGGDCPPEPPAAPNAVASIDTECGAADITLTNPLGEAPNGRQTASFIVYVDGDFYGAYAVVADGSEVVNVTFPEDSGLHEVEVYRSGIESYALIASADDIESNCEPDVITTIPEAPTFTQECGTEGATTIPEVGEGEHYTYESELFEGITFVWAVADEGYVFPKDTVTEWNHTFTAVVPCPIPDVPTTVSQVLASTGSATPWLLAGTGALALFGGLALFAAAKLSPGQRRSK